MSRTRAMHIIRIAALLALAVLTATAALAADKAAAKGGDTVPTKITSDSMRVEQGGAKVVFTGNVVVTRPDMTIRSRTLTVYTPPREDGAGGPAAGGQGRIDRIVAQGDVRIVREGRTGNSDKATWHEAEGLLVMEGDPVLREGDNEISGKVIKIWIRDGRSEVVGGDDKRVEATFFTPEGTKEP